MCRANLGTCPSPGELLWSQQLRGDRTSRPPGHTESRHIRAGGVLESKAKSRVAMAVSLLPPGASAYLHSFIHLFILSLTQQLNTAYSVPMKWEH